MKIWKSLLVLLTVLTLAAAGYWVYTKYFSSSKISNLELLSQDAVFVLESQQTGDFWNELVAHPSWNIFKNYPAFQKLSSHLITLDSLTGNSGKINQLLNKNTFTVSYHPTGSENFDLLFTLQASEGTGQNLQEEITQKLPKGARLSTRSYSDQPVIEYFDEKNTRSWSFSFLGSVIVASQSSLLIEEAIRNFINPELPTYQDLIPKNQQNTKSRPTLWVSGKGLGSLLRGVGNQRESLAVRSLQNIEAVTGLEISLEEGEIRMEGPIFLQENINFTPSISANLTEIQKAISMATYSVTQFNLQSIFETQALENRAFSGKSTFLAEVQRNLVDRGFLDSFTGELYLLELEAFGGSSQNLALLARSSESQQAFDLLRNFVNSQGSQTTDFYANKEILYVGDEEFPAHLFKGKFFGFNQTFITQVDELLIFANSQQAMKLILDDYQNQNNWANEQRAPEAKKALSPTSGFSRIYLTSKIWDSWTKLANPSWSTFLQKYASAFQAFPYVSFKINQIGDERRATLILPLASTDIKEIKTETMVSLKAESKIPFNSKLIFGPQAISNYQDGTEDIIVQDQENVVYLINSAGEIVYNQKLSGPIVSDVFQIDYYKNGKLQALLATSDAIYGIDRLGNPLPNYPFRFNSEKIRHLNLVDYDNNKEYRYFLSTEQGSLYLLDKTGERLEGWNPLQIGGKTVSPPTHYRVPGKGDFMVASTESGSLFLFNRRGEKQSGSPIKLTDELSSGLVYNRTAGSAGFFLSAISSNGEIIHVNFDGEVSYRNQLIIEDKDNDFVLVPDQQEMDFVIISRNFNQIKVMNREEEELFSVRVAEGNLKYQYFDFGSGRKIIVITDPLQEFSYLYDMSGNLLTQLPPESLGKLEISYQANLGQYLIRTISGNYLTTYQLSD
ncbi:MAG TPA: hypothetical protein DCY95_00240 [Algoriphagus sp.]|uniref:hypothetical protein n=2 Tax=Algoriphagus TaxID=246875 RepID=UPI000C60403D|nr:MULTISPECIES: hypothetical protein [unclassified Algoriphagus]MAL14983.1 hypothetical protein [Algoriphagus sp.]QYH39841.1 hypothetical protein GYM62_14005 [Algoriphagus sp. NBT04N3]HAZ23300.1 hypothetical protein [Algoriphagus sp.]HCH44642.1 hypothetical protein [Algoriphagus sp.]